MPSLHVIITPPSNRDSRSANWQGRVCFYTKATSPGPIGDLSAELFSHHLTKVKKLRSLRRPAFSAGFLLFPFGRARLVFPCIREVREQSPWGVALLPPGEDGQDVLPTDESRCSCPHQMRHARKSGSRRSCLPWRRIAPNARFQELCDLAGIKHKADAETGQPKPWELKGPPQDVRDVLRRAHARVVRRDPWPFGRRDHLPPLRACASARVQSDHDFAAADGIRACPCRLSVVVSGG